MSEFEFIKDIQGLDPSAKALYEAATKDLSHAYAPYSHFSVCAAVLLRDGSIITGTNQENAAYPSGMCAERVALYAVASQKPGIAIEKILVIAKRINDDVLASASPCGPCRQVMLEFEARQQTPFEVIMLYEPPQFVKAPSAASLLPLSFSAANLGKADKRQ
jgi:cytidine deaminase